MSTTATPPSASPSLLAKLRDSAGALSVGLFWGGGMLIILALWLTARDPEASRAIPGVLGALGLAAMGLGCVPAVTRWQARPAEEQSARLLQQRKVLGLILLVGGLVLLILALVIGITHKPDGSLGLNYGSFGESLGLLLLSLATLGAGASLQRAPDAD